MIQQNGTLVCIYDCKAVSDLPRGSTSLLLHKLTHRQALSPHLPPKLLKRGVCVCVCGWTDGWGGCFVPSPVCVIQANMDAAIYSVTNNGIGASHVSNSRTSVLSVDKAMNETPAPLLFKEDGGLIALQKVQCIIGSQVAPKPGSTLTRTILYFIKCMIIQLRIIVNQLIVFFNCSS